MTIPERQPAGHGFIFEPIKSEDLVFGGVQTLKLRGYADEPLNESGDWLPFIYDWLLTYQAKRFETNSCASQQGENARGLMFNAIYGEKPDGSERFLAKISGTDPARGNTFQKVNDALRNKGIAKEEEWPDTVETVEQYYADIPQELQNKAKADRGEHVWGYERVNPDIATMKEALKYSPLGISCALWQDADGEYSKPEGWRDSHAITLLNIRADGKFTLLDSYPPYIKIAKPFAPEMAMRFFLDRELTNGLVKLIRLLTQWLATFPQKIRGVLGYA